MGLRQSAGKSRATGVPCVKHDRTGESAGAMDAMQCKSEGGEWKAPPV